MFRAKHIMIAVSGEAAAPPRTVLPKVLLIGDSISSGYTMFVTGALDDVARVERINAIKFLENYDLERATFCEQKAFPLKLPLQKNFDHCGVESEMWELKVAPSFTHSTFFK